MVEYDTPMKGQRYIQECKKQIQEDIIAFIDSPGFHQIIAHHVALEPNKELLVNKEYRKNVLCKIVADNFKTLEK